MSILCIHAVWFPYKYMYLVHMSSHNIHNTFAITICCHIYILVNTTDPQHVSPLPTCTTCMWKCLKRALHVLNTSTRVTTLYFYYRLSWPVAASRWPSLPCLSCQVSGPGCWRWQMPQLPKYSHMDIIFVLLFYDSSKNKGWKIDTGNCFVTVWK